MATVEERMKILRMVEAGTITAEEGAKLLAALEQSRKRERQASRQAPEGPAGASARWVRIRVTDEKTGRAKVNINLPIGLVNLGLKVGARFVPDTAELNMEELRQALFSGQLGKIIEAVGEDGERVEIFLE